MKGPRIPEKVVQEHVKQALRAVGATVYTIGRPPRRDATHKGTGQTPGIPDLLAHLPDSPLTNIGGMSGVPVMHAHQLWVEVKAKGGRLSQEQASFRDFCELAGIAHIVGGLDDVLAYLVEYGYVKETAHYRHSA